MCGRYTLILLHDLKTIFPWIAESDPEPPPRYNIAPTQQVLAATNEPKPKFDFLHWGLIPVGRAASPPYWPTPAARS
jgi:putative SOS response-associated peptidase YedK